MEHHQGQDPLEETGKGSGGARRVGRPPKKDYNADALMEELIDEVAQVYREKGEIKATARELSLPPNKVKKLLITGGELVCPERERILKLKGQGKSMEEIQNALVLSYSAIHTYLPYSKVIYKMDQVSQNAERVKRYKDWREAVARLRRDCTEENLWGCILAFQEYPFHTSSGLPFTYTLKRGRSGAFTRELFIDRRANSKSLAWSSVRIAFEKALEKRETVFTRPKEVGDIRGISYSYSLLWRFGVIRVPEEVEEKLRGKN